MKKLDTKTLNKLEEAYSSSLLNRALETAFSKVEIRTLGDTNNAYLNKSFKFSNEIETLPVTNQKQSGRCWIFAGLNVLREIVAKKYDLSSFEFSQNYTAFYDKLEKINYFIESIDDFLTCDNDDRTLKHIINTGIQDGGQWDMFVSLVKKYGLVPKEAMPETIQSSQTGYMNALINVRLRKYVASARKLVSEGKKSELSSLKKDTLNELYTLLCRCFSTPPKSFSLELVDKNNKYRIFENMTPVAFFNEIIGAKIDDYVSVVNAPTIDKPYYKTYTVAYLGNVVSGNEIKYLNLPMEELEALSISQLLDKEVVWFGSDVAKCGNREEGYWDIESFDYVSLFGFSIVDTKENCLNYGMSQMNHAMLLTGVNLKNGLPTKWKVENSWGSEKGSKGYYVMGEAWFKQYVFQAVIDKKYLNKKQLEALSEKPIVLSPWDPMGSLAE